MRLFSKIKRVHMIGIKGTGMSALAVNLKSTGIKVSGSDFAESFFTDALLAAHKIRVTSPYSVSNIPDNTDLVVVSTAYNNKNPELQEAERLGLKIMTYPQVLGLISKKLRSVAICGSHGKTTTSGILAYILSKTDFQPIVNVGSIVPQLVSYKARDPKLFVFEADEYQNKFQYFFPKIVILTNVDYDHPDYFKDVKKYKSVFREFVKRIPANGLLIYCADDKNTVTVVKSAHCRKIGYGFSKTADVQIKITGLNPGQMTFELKNRRRPSQDFTSRLIGHHNALNLATAITCTDYLKVNDSLTLKAIADFRGTKRRMEITKKLKINGNDCIVVDDFGHHPTEIRNTISTLKTAYPGRTLWTVFQPHSFSRTEVLFKDFVKAFDESDKTIILDIYGSKRESGGKIHSHDLVKKMNSPDVTYKPDIAAATEFLKTKIKTPSIILTLGASEVWRLAELF